MNRARRQGIADLDRRARLVPTCPVCDRAVRRAVFDENGGTCTPCRDVIEANRPVQLALDDLG